MWGMTSDNMNECNENSAMPDFIEIFLSNPNSDGELFRNRIYQHLNIQSRLEFQLEIHH